MSKNKQNKSDVETTEVPDPADVPAPEPAPATQDATSAPSDPPAAAPPSTLDDGVVELGPGIDNAPAKSMRWILQLDGRDVADLVATEEGIELVPVEGGAPILHPASATPDPFGGAVPMELHISGAAWNNNEVLLIRCATSGELADQWMVAVGDKLLCNDGKDTVGRKPYRHVPTGLQARVRWPLEKAMQIAQDAR